MQDTFFFPRIYHFKHLRITFKEKQQLKVLCRWKFHFFYLEKLMKPKNISILRETQPKSSPFHCSVRLAVLFNRKGPRVTGPHDGLTLSEGQLRAVEPIAPGLLRAVRHLQKTRGRETRRIWVHLLSDPPAVMDAVVLHSTLPSAVNGYPLTRK